MNQPHFEVFPETRSLAESEPETRDGWIRVPTGQFAWHFKDANGRVTHVGGQGFATRYDAHRSIHGVVSDHAAILLGMVSVTLSVPRSRLPIVDLDENGDVIDNSPGA